MCGKWDEEAKKQPTEPTELEEAYATLIQAYKDHNKSHEDYVRIVE